MSTATMTPGVGPGWDLALERYRPVLYMGLRGHGRRSPGKIGKKYRELDRKLKAAFTLIHGEEFTKLGFSSKFEIWAQKQFGWKETTRENCSGLVSPGGDTFREELHIEMDQMEEEGDSDLTICRHVKRRTKAFVKTLTWQRV